MSVVESNPSHVSDHAFRTDGNYWDRCTFRIRVHPAQAYDELQLCGLSEAAHRDTDNAAAINAALGRLPYRCPDCVTAGRDVCDCRARG
jgi:hypothetical protein